MITDYLTTPDGRTMSLNGGDGPDVHCYSIYGHWNPGRIMATGIVHAVTKEEAERYVRASGLDDFQVRLSY